MKNIFFNALVAAGLASLLCGCNKSETSQPNADTGSTPSAPAANPPASTAPAATTPAPAVPAQAVEAVKSAASDAATTFVEQAKAAADTKLGPIATDLTQKVQALTSTANITDAIKQKLDSTLQSLTGGQDATALGSAFQLPQIVEAAKLTPQQLDLAKQVGNLTSAFVVQKDFSALEGAQGDVATIVNSLCKGDITTAVPALKNVATNAHLTDSQKQLITTIADKYAPGWEKVQGAVDSIKKLPGF